MLLQLVLAERQLVDLLLPAEHVLARLVELTAQVLYLLVLESDFVLEFDVLHRDPFVLHVCTAGRADLVRAIVLCLARYPLVMVRLQVLVYRLHCLVPGRGSDGVGQIIVDQ